MMHACLRLVSILGINMTKKDLFIIAAFEQSKAIYLYNLMFKDPWNPWNNSVKITEFYSRHFYTKIPWKQLFG